VVDVMKDYTKLAPLTAGVRYEYKLLYSGIPEDDNK
jgi:hypothetical protein